MGSAAALPTGEINHVLYPRSALRPYDHRRRRRGSPRGSIRMPNDITDEMMSDTMALPCGRVHASGWQRAANVRKAKERTKLLSWPKPRRGSGPNNEETQCPASRR